MFTKNESALQQSAVSMYLALFGLFQYWEKMVVHLTYHLFENNLK